MEKGGGGYEKCPAKVRKGNRGAPACGSGLFWVSVCEPRYRGAEIPAGGGYPSPTEGAGGLDHYRGCVGYCGGLCVLSRGPVRP